MEPKFVKILVPYYMCNEYDIFGSYSQNSMLALPKDNSDLIHKEHQ